MSPARRLPAIATLRSAGATLRPASVPAWARHAAWFALWWLGGFAATLAVLAC